MDAHANDLAPDIDHPAKKRRTAGPTAPLTSTLPRQVVSAADIFAQVTKENLIVVVEDHAEKLNILSTAIGQSIISQQASTAASGGHSHRIVLFIVDDNQSIGEYVTELEDMDLTVEPYTVAMHSSGSDQWANVIYNDVVVVTANILLESLSDDSLKLPQAHLVVISDAQRIVPMLTPHPVLRMMSDFYSKIPDPPRILAMLTSSPERWLSLDLPKLETPLRAQSCFLATKAVDSWLGPMEMVVEYEVDGPTQQDHPMSTELRLADPQGLLLQRYHYRRATAVFLQLGSFAVRTYWRKVLGTITGEANLGDPRTIAIYEAFNMLKAQGAAEPLDIVSTSPRFNITPKLAKLMQVLALCVHHAQRFSLLVKDRVVAETLVDILQVPEANLQRIRPVAVCGNTQIGSAGQDRLRAFASGTHNLLVLTKSSEDMDIPQVTMTINFDLFDDQLSYAYGHAHSRGRNSHFVHMIERGNNAHRRVLAQLQIVHSDLRAWRFKMSCDDGDLPCRAMYIGLDPYRSDSEEETEDDRLYLVDATTSARLYKSDAIAAMHRFAAQLQGPPDGENGKISISLEERPNDDGEASFRYTLSFPKPCALPVISGPFCSSKWEARREACYQACRDLVQVALMDHRHFPQARQLPTDARGSLNTDSSSVAAQDIKTANTSAKTHGYPRKLPDFWANSQASTITTLYPTIIAPDNMGGEPHAPVLLLTRAPFPSPPDLSLFFSGSRATTHFFKAVPLEVNETQLRALHGYTLRITKSLTNKPFECPFGSLLSYFAPLDASWPSIWSPNWPLLSIGEHITWDAVKLAADYFATPLVDGTASIDDRASDAIVLDRQVEFTMRHFIVKVRHDLTPLSKPEDSPREAGYLNFIEYCKARRKDFQGVKDENQPMIEVCAVPGVINNLHPTSAPPTPPTKAPLKYLIPELCYKFTIPASFFRTLWLMPSIMNKIDSYLLVKELNARLFDNLILEQQLLIALSTPAAWTECNYERLEFLGDSFLKVVASNFCYATMPSGNAGDLHTKRQSIISNNVLQECATLVGVPSYIQHKRFVAKLWQPPVVSTENARPEDAEGDIQMTETGQETKDKGKRSKKRRQLDEQNTLWMGDKIIADVVEAILAASFLSGGHEVALQVARRLQIPIPNVAQWSDYARINSQASQTRSSVPDRIPAPSTIHALQQILLSTFSKPELVGQALTHTSVIAGSEGISYDRLEFIGDAVIDFLVCRFIWERHPYLSPGGLTMLKAAMVSNKTLAAFCVRIGLHQHLLVQSKELSTSIQNYIDFLEELQKKEYDLATRENRLPGQYWLDMPIEPPKCLSDVVESVIGALYVSDNFFEVGVGRFFEGVFKPFLEAHVRLQTLSTNPKVTLLELLQAEGCQNNAVVKQPAARQNMPVQMDVVIHGKVIASATDESPTIATRKVSLAALDALAGDPELLARTCDCKSTVTIPDKDSSSRKHATKRRERARDEEAEAAEVEAVMDVGDDVE